MIAAPFEVMVITAAAAAAEGIAVVFFVFSCMIMSSVALSAETVMDLLNEDNKL